MKKLLSVLLIAVMCVSLTGCGKKVTCTKTETGSDGKKEEEKVVINYKDNKITKLETIASMEVDKDSADSMVSLLKVGTDKYNEITGINAETKKDGDSKIKMSVAIDFNKLDLDKAKSVFGDDDDFLSAKDVKFDEFKKNLEEEGYSCK